MSSELWLIGGLFVGGVVLSVVGLLLAIIPKRFLMACSGWSSWDGMKVLEQVHIRWVVRLFGGVIFVGGGGVILFGLFLLGVVLA